MQVSAQSNFRILHHSKQETPYPLAITPSKSKKECLGIKLWFYKIEIIEELEEISKNIKQNKSGSYQWKEMRYREPMANK